MAGPACDDHGVPARPPSRGALVALAFGAAAVVAALCPPGSVQHVGPLASTRPLARVLPAALGVPPGGDDPADAATVLLGSPTASPTPAPAPDPDAPTAADLAAGIQRRTVAPAGGGEFDTVPGSAPAPGQGEIRTIRVEVERGLPVDGARFAEFVLATLNDDRGWGHDGAMTFARTDGDAPITVVLASPDTSARLCGDAAHPRHALVPQRPARRADLPPLGQRDREYADNVTGYRQYVVNHEVGHALGHGHERCPGPAGPRR